MRRNFKSIFSTICVASMVATTAVGCGNTAAPATDGDVAANAGAELVNQTADEEVPAIEGYDLLWHDEFNGTTLDESNWNRELRDPGWTNNELQAYVADEANIYVKDGVLTLQALKGEDGSYTSGKVNSQNLRDFQYGKVVVSAKTPEGKGLWPAIWMMPQDESFYGQWPKCGEIDIMEVLGDNTALSYSTIHYGEPHAEQQGTITLTDGTFASDFHEYSVEWEPGEMRFYTDDELVLTVNDWFTAVEGEDEKEYPAPFNQPFFVQMNLAVGGNWPGDPDENTDFDNAKFEIDYVRVYQKPEYDMNVEKPAKAYKEPDATGNYLNNGDFAVEEDLADDQDWTFYLASGGAGTATIHDGLIEIQTESMGDQDYSVQIFQPNLPMIKGHKYKMSFDAYADEERDIVVCVSAPTAGWIRYLQDTTLTLSTEMTTYEYEFEITAKDDNNGRAEFNLGNRGSAATVYITNVRVEEVQ